MFSNTLKKVSGCVADITCISQITYKQRIAYWQLTAWLGNQSCSKIFLLNESHFKILRKCQGKFDCLVFEILYIKKFSPNVNVQTDSIHAKLFVQPAWSFYTFLVWQWCHINVKTSSILIQLFSFFYQLF